ncbi:cytochrome C oxidase Cbb3 [Flavobacterium sp. NST-5]|uniref:Cytochrome C oxidase Cbb3 n=1 Tax=Flavobacterium ichthyis TaxID=2698827 RepID=A0ABW9Z9L5_9FLAO|nr:FixH family protein [Flavobacterium ichthyis]NBL64032.1 cytochrome C oxidase Cbb3 [Flavobacterium ichthyis]
MKINWGTGIVIAFALFMSFILFFVFLVQSDSKYDNELVLEDYYRHENNLQSQINKEIAAENLQEKVVIETLSEGILVHFPKNFNFKKIKGKVFLYRPSNQKLDFEKNISLSDSFLLIPKTALVDGRWNITIDWSYGENNFLTKENLIIK